MPAVHAGAVVVIVLDQGTLQLMTRRCAKTLWGCSPEQPDADDDGPEWSTTRPNKCRKRPLRLGHALHHPEALLDDPTRLAQEDGDSCFCRRFISSFWRLAAWCGWLPLEEKESLFVGTVQSNSNMSNHFRKLAMIVLWSTLSKRCGDLPWTYVTCQTDGDRGTVWTWIFPPGFCEVWSGGVHSPPHTQRHGQGHGNVQCEAGAVSRYPHTAYRAYDRGRRARRWQGWECW